MLEGPFCTPFLLFSSLLKCLALLRPFSFLGSSLLLRSFAVALFFRPHRANVGFLDLGAGLSLMIMSAEETMRNGEAKISS